MPKNFLEQNIPAGLLGKFQPFLMKAPVDVRPGLGGFTERLQIGVYIQRFGGGKDFDRVSILQPAGYRHPRSIHQRALAFVTQLGMDAIGKIEDDLALGRNRCSGRTVGIDFFGFREPDQVFRCVASPPYSPILRNSSLISCQCSSVNPFCDCHA